MLLHELLAPYNLVLASQSPRRHELLKGLNLPFSIQVIDGIEESYPSNIKSESVPCFLAEKKCDAYDALLSDSKNVLITADTIVILNERILEKPRDKQHAKLMLQQLSGNKHTVVTGVCIAHGNKRRVFSSHTEVQFASLSEEEIDFYINAYSPLDKAGSYGVQEWIGFVGIESITGSYFNVMGLPVHALYAELQSFILEL